MRAHDSKMFLVIRFNDDLLLFWLKAARLIRKNACRFYGCACPKRLLRLTIWITSKHCTKYSKRTSSSKRWILNIFNIRIVDKRHYKSFPGCTLQRSNMHWIHDTCHCHSPGYFKMIQLFSFFTYFGKVENYFSWKSIWNDTAFF